MACNNLSAARVTEIESRITQLGIFITEAYAAVSAAMASGGIESFKFDSGDASQWAKYHTPEQLLKNVDILFKQIDYWNGKLNCTSNVYMNLRRKQQYLYGVLRA